MEQYLLNKLFFVGIMIQRLNMVFFTISARICLFSMRGCALGLPPTLGLPRVEKIFFFIGVVTLTEVSVVTEGFKGNTAFWSSSFDNEWFSLQR